MVGADSAVCSKVTVPFTLESPRRTATSGRVSHYCGTERYVIAEPSRRSAQDIVF